MFYARALRAAVVLFPVLLFPLAALPQDAPKEKAEPKAGEERSFEIADGVKMVFCWIPPGEAQLGSPKAERDAVLKRLSDAKEPDWLAAEAEDKRGKYTARGFWLGKYEVTQAEWAAVTGKNPSYFDGKQDNKAKGLDAARFPVEQVSWNDCQGFLTKVNGRAGAAKVFGGAGTFALPHEDEWEYAARGGKGNKQAFYWGDRLNGTEANCNGNYPYGTDTKGRYLERPCQVEDTNGGKYERHPWGLQHMIGNIWEWCENEYSKDRRVLRGGSWGTGGVDCRTAFRHWTPPVTAYDFIGLRVCFRPDR
ncbi:MAG: formylglycine-generating enzyme family protein [Isosphaera sp.]|nr:formylglycine-generating enzyme family protein [Isosphaera sp.]